MLLGFNVQEADSIGIIGGDDGPTAIYLTTKLSPHLLLSLIHIYAVLDMNCVRILEIRHSTAVRTYGFGLDPIIPTTG